MFLPIFRILLLPLIFTFLLFGCASSNVSRDAAANVDLGIQNAKNLVDGASIDDFPEAYGNTKQVTKGAIIGGAAGAIAGAVTGGIGVGAAAATGAVLGASYGNYIDCNTSLQDRLENRGVSFVIIGDQVLIVLSSARFFQPMTATIKPQSYSTLGMLAQYINKYTKTLVKISAYTNQNACAPDLALSKMQAQNIAKALVASGMNARLVYAEGYGGTHLVDSTALSWDASDNYRVEITFEKLYV